MVAADVYSMLPHVGRGGWTWYTGSAGWFDRVDVESILGLRLEGDWLMINPCVPASWPGFEMTLRYRGAVYEIVVRNPRGVSCGTVDVTLDGATQAQVHGQARIRLREDGAVHTIKVTLGLV